MTYSHTSRRLPTDAKIVLERAGYHVEHGKPWLIVTAPGFGDHLAITGGTVDNSAVVALLKLKGFNEFGHLITRSGM